MPYIDRTDQTPFYHQIYDQIVALIESGSYQAHMKLPSIRQMAIKLGVSNSTVELAYQRLFSEGYVEAKRGSGYFVNEKSAAMRDVAQPEVSQSEDAAALREFQRVRQTHPSVRYDFSYTTVDASIFPYKAWSRISRDVMFTDGASQACLYNDNQGLESLRVQIALHANARHGLHVTADQVLIMPTVRDTVISLLGLFDPVSTVVGMQEPGYNEVNAALDRQGFAVKRILSFPSKDDADWEKQLQDVNLLFTFPASCFPLNKTMSREERLSSLSWAQNQNAYIIEDEYGCDFIEGPKNVEPICSMDEHDRTIFVGSFSEVFTPAICLAYAILPPKLMIAWLKANGSAHPHVPWQTQAAMAQFMEEGLWDAHIRKVVALMRRKRDAAKESLEKHFGSRIDTVGDAQSQYLMIQFDDERSESELITAALSSGVRVYPTRKYWHGDVDPQWRVIMLGLGSIAFDDIDDGISTLAQAWM